MGSSAWEHGVVKASVSVFFNESAYTCIKEDGISLLEFLQNVGARDTLRHPVSFNYDQL